MSIAIESRLFRLCLVAAALTAFTFWVSRPLPTPGIEILDSSAAQPLSFEANLGQAPEGYEFLVATADFSSLIAADRIETHLHDTTQEASIELETRFVGANANARARGLEEQEHRKHYFFGNDRSKWVREVPTFQRARFEQVYPGVDLVYYGAAGKGGPRGEIQTLEHDFLVQPGADPASIRMAFEGAGEPRTDAFGNLLFDTGAGALVYRKPDVYQAGEDGGRAPVEGSYVLLADGSVGFELGEYDRGRELTIDPLFEIQRSTFSGGGARDDAVGITINSLGQTITCGWTSSTNFPPGTQQRGPTDIWVTIREPDGAPLSTSVISGSSEDVCTDVGVDHRDNIYISGFSDSADYPTTEGGRSGAGFQAVITMLSPDGSSQRYSQSFGGDSGEDANALAVLPCGEDEVLVGFTGRTRGDYPVTDGTTFGGGNFDGFLTVVKLLLLEGGASALRTQATYLNGSADDDGKGIAPYTPPDIMTTETPDFAVTATPAPTGTPPPSRKGFVVGMNTSSPELCDGGQGDAFLGAFFWTDEGLIAGPSSCLGGSGQDTVESVAVDSGSRVIAALSTTSTNLLTTSNAPQPDYPGGSRSGAIYILDLESGMISLGTYDGSSEFDQLSGATVTPQDGIFAFGQTAGRDYPVTADALQPANQGSINGTLALFTRHGERRYGSHHGGSGTNSIIDCVTGRNGRVSCVSVTGPGFPTTPNADQTSFGGPPFDGGFVSFTEGAPFFVPEAALEGASFNSAPAVGSGAAVFLLNGGEFFVAGGVPLPNVAPDNTFVEIRNSTISAPLGEEGAAPNQAAIRAPILFSSPLQINFQLPWEATPSADGTVTAVITVNGVPSFPVEIPVETFAPAMYTFDFGPGRAVAIHQDGAVAHPAGSIAGVDSRPASAGDVLILLASGLGPTDPPAITGANSFDDTGAFVRRDTVALPRVFVGDQEAEVVFSGMSPEFVGVYQLNIVMPEGVTPGDQVTLVIEVEGKRSRGDVTIAVE